MDGGPVTERWLPIPTAEVFEVSDVGRLRRASSQLVRKVSLDRKGYPRIALEINGKAVSLAIHRAVMAAFQPRPDWRSMQVNHRDGDRANNRLENLEWCTASENRLHSYRVLGQPNPSAGRFGSAHHNARPVIGLDIATGAQRRYAAVAETRADGFKPSAVSACANGAQKSHRGWAWSHEAVL